MDFLSCSSISKPIQKSSVKVRGHKHAVMRAAADQVKNYKRKKAHYLFG